MTILVGYTPRNESRAALEEALRIAQLTGEDLVVLNATPGGEHKHGSSLGETEQRRLQSILDASGITSELRQYARGRSTLEEFRDVAAELNPSLVVIGVRRRGGLGKFVMGSVTDQLLRELDQPVLCVKSRPEPSPSRRSSAAEESEPASATGAVAEVDATHEPDAEAHPDDDAHPDSGPRR